VQIRKELKSKTMRYLLYDSLAWRCG